MWNFKSRLYLKLQEENDFLRRKSQRVNVVLPIAYVRWHAQHSNGRSFGWTAARCLLSSDHLSKTSSQTKQSKRFGIRSTRSALWSAKCFFNVALSVNLKNKITTLSPQINDQLDVTFNSLFVTHPAPVTVGAVFQTVSVEIVFLFVPGTT